jgi:hypothetical protein
MTELKKEFISFFQEMPLNPRLIQPCSRRNPPRKLRLRQRNRPALVNSGVRAEK